MALVICGISTVRSLAVPVKSCDAVAWYGPIPSEELKKGRSGELEHWIEYEAFDEVHELPLGHKACDIVWVDEWRGDTQIMIVCSTDHS